MKNTHRTLKNVIMILVIAAMFLSAAFTAYFAKDAFAANSAAASISQTRGGPDGGMTRPDRNARDGSSSQDSSSDSTQNTPPEMPNSGNSDDQNGMPPTPPDMQNGNGNGQNGMPSMPNGNGQSSSTDAGTTQTSTDDSGSLIEVETSATPDNGTQTGMPTPPDMQNGSGDSQNGMPSMPGIPTQNSGESERSSTPVFPYYILFVTEGLIAGLTFIYLLMSRFNKKTLKETLHNMDKVVILLLATVIFVTAFAFAGGKISKAVAGTGSSSSETAKAPSGASDSTAAEVSGATKVTDNQTLNGQYASSASDESALLVTDGGNATVEGATITKSAGDATDTEASEFNGVNSGVLVQSGSTASISNTTITTNAKGSNAVFATGENAKITLSDVTIKTSGSSGSRGLDATYGGTIEAARVNITTKGASSAALATDRGEGTVTVSDSTLETNGAGSPVIYSTGDISVTGTTGTANGAQMAVIEGKNSATVTNSTLTASAAGNRGEVDQAGVMIYQSMSGDAGEGTGTFTAANSSLSIQKASNYYKTAPMFFITNTSAVINLENTKLDFGSGILISAKGTDEWGKSGSNGGNVTLNAVKQTLTGSVEADALSSVFLNLTASTYEGAINTANTAASVTLTLDKDSRIKLTGDTYVTTLQDADATYKNIDFNGFTLYVGGKAIN